MTQSKAIRGRRANYLPDWFDNMYLCTLIQLSRYTLLEKKTIGKVHDGRTNSQNRAAHGLTTLINYFLILFL